jgi:hypothetical protein
MIQEAAGEPLYALCNDLTTAVAQAMEKGLDREALAAELGLASEPQAMLIGYHSVMWGLMERLVERGALELPRALAEPAAAERSSAADLLVLVHRPVAAPAEDGDGE